MGKEGYVNLAGIAYESLVNGPGLRRVLFAQGCSHNCKGCFNPETHSFEGGELVKIDKLVEDILANPMLRGVTFSGGDPLEQADKFSKIAKKIKEHGKDVWSYTGFSFEYILEHQEERNGWKEFIQNIDVLIDGKFVEGLHDPRLKFRGSSNQRIIDVKESLISGRVILKQLN